MERSFITEDNHMFTVQYAECVWGLYWSRENSCITCFYFCSDAKKAPAEKHAEN